MFWDRFTPFRGRRRAGREARIRSLGTAAIVVLGLGGTATAEASDLAALLAHLEAADVERVEILQTPPRILTRTRITPSMLQRGHTYRLTIRSLPGTAYAEELKRVLGTVTFAATRDLPDVRWGILFYDRQGSRLGSVFLDRTGRRGVVDGNLAVVSGGLGPWLVSRFGPCFR